MKKTSKSFWQKVGFRANVGRDHENGTSTDCKFDQELSSILNPQSSSDFFQQTRFVGLFSEILLIGAAANVPKRAELN